MADELNPKAWGDAEYAEIEDAVLETVRGRWFLNEYRKRCTAADTHRLLDAMERLETTLRPGPMAQTEFTALAATVLAGRDYMASVRNYRLPDAGAVPAGETVYAHVAAAAETIELGLMDATDALRLIASALETVPAAREAAQAVASQITQLETLTRRQEVLARRVANAMGTLAHAEERILAHVPSDVLIGLTAPAAVPADADPSAELPAPPLPPDDAPQAADAAADEPEAPAPAAKPSRSNRIVFIKSVKHPGIPLAEEPGGSAA